MFRTSSMPPFIDNLLYLIEDLEEEVNLEVSLEEQIEAIETNLAADYNLLESEYNNILEDWQNIIQDYWNGDAWKRARYIEQFIYYAEELEEYVLICAFERSRGIIHLVQEDNWEGPVRKGYIPI